MFYPPGFHEMSHVAVSFWRCTMPWILVECSHISRIFQWHCQWNMDFLRLLIGLTLEEQKKTMYGNKLQGNVCEWNYLHVSMICFLELPRVHIFCNVQYFFTHWEDGDKSTLNCVNIFHVSYSCSHVDRANDFLVEIVHVFFTVIPCSILKSSMKWLMLQSHFGDVPCHRY